MIGLEQVSFGYGEKQETLSQVSATVARGECVLLCGASGCGKTTVTKLINGLIPAFTPGCRLEGRVMVNGLAPRETPMYELAQRVGSVFQNPKSQFFNLDTDSELAFGLEMRVVRRKRSAAAWSRSWKRCISRTCGEKHLFSVRWAKAASGLWLRLCHGP